MDFRVLGTIEVVGPSPSSSPPGAKERAILARLLLDAGRTVTADALLEAAWEGVPREAAARSLAVRVANLRSFLEPGRDRGAPSRCSCATARATGWRSRPSRSTPIGSSAASARPPVCRPPRRWTRTTARSSCGAAGRSAISAGAEFAQAEIRRLEDLKQPGRGGARPRARRAGAPAGGGARAAPPRGRRPAARGARLHADARALRRGPARRGARRLPRPGGAARRARACRPARARARSSAASSTTTPALAAPCAGADRGRPERGAPAARRRSGASRSSRACARRWSARWRAGAPA